MTVEILRKGRTKIPKDRVTNDEDECYTVINKLQRTGRYETLPGERPAWRKMRREILHIMNTTCVTKSCLMPALRTLEKGEKQYYPCLKACKV